MKHSPEHSDQVQQALAREEQARLEAQAKLEEQARLEAEAKVFFESALLAEQDAAFHGWAAYVKAIGASAYAAAWEKASYRHKKAWVEVVRSFDRATPSP